MTSKYRGNYEAPFSAWVREQPALDSVEECINITDLDYLIHRYLLFDKEGRTLLRTHIMVLELKTGGADRDFAQEDTQNIIDQMLRYAHNKPVRTARDRKRVWYHGLHVLRLSGTRPGDGGAMMWDGKPVSEGQLISLLRFDLDATTMLPREERSHHKPLPYLFRPSRT